MSTRTVSKLSTPSLGITTNGASSSR
jgi:hypothetical protein